MEILNIIFGIITFFSFLFALYQRYEVKKHALTEKYKVVVQATRLTDIYESIKSLGSNVDMIVQVPKHQEVTVQEMQNMARGARLQVFGLMKIVKGETKRLDEWRYGKMLPSTPIEEDDNQ